MVELLQPLWYLGPWQQRSKLTCACTEMLSFQFWLQGWPSPTDHVCFLIVQISWTPPKRHSVDSVTPMWSLTAATRQNLNWACQGWCECLISHGKKAGLILHVWEAPRQRVINALLVSKIGLEPGIQNGFGALSEQHPEGCRTSTQGLQAHVPFTSHSLHYRMWPALHSYVFCMLHHLYLSAACITTQ